MAQPTDPRRRWWCSLPLRSLLNRPAGLEQQITDHRPPPCMSSVPSASAGLGSAMARVLLVARAPCTSQLELLSISLSTLRGSGRPSPVVTIAQVHIGNACAVCRMSPSSIYCSCAEAGLIGCPSDPHELRNRLGCSCVTLECLRTHTLVLEYSQGQEIYIGVNV